MSTPASVLMHVFVSKLDIMHTKGKQRWEEIEQLCRRDENHRATVKFILQTSASPHTFTRELKVSNVRLIAGYDEKVTFTVHQNGAELQGSINLFTGKGTIITV